MTATSHAILIVDPNPEVAGLFRQAAEGSGLSVKFARCPDDAWLLLERDTPMAVFADYRQRGVDGLSLLLEVGLRMPKVKRILHTAERLERREAGVDIPVLGKPVDVDALRALLQALKDL